MATKKSAKKITAKKALAKKAAPKKVAVKKATSKKAKRKTKLKKTIPESIMPTNAFDEIPDDVDCICMENSTASSCRKAVGFRPQQFLFLQRKFVKMPAAKSFYKKSESLQQLTVGLFEENLI